MEVITKSASETFKLGKKIGSGLVEGQILAFEGGLGAGKTTFIQGLASGMGIKSKIISPTFILMRTYKLNPKLHKGNFYHLDLYRLEENIESEVENLGLKDIWRSGEDIVAIEWAERISEILPKNTIWVKIENVDNDTRKIIIENL